MADVETINVSNSPKETESDRCTSTPATQLSKTQLKKLRKKEKWQQVKAEKRKAEKERYKERKRSCRERGENTGLTRKQLKHNTMSKSKCQVRVLIDCGFDECMSEKDIRMLVKQIQFCYSANRRSENPLQLYCCGVTGKTQERLESIGDFKSWDIHFKSEEYTELFDKSSLVYLSSESPNILQSLEEDKVYVIGGLVDHNHCKGLCHRLAEEKGIAHAHLPISDYMDMKTRKVLAINHVFEILLHYTETKSWHNSFYTVLPPRKGAIPKSGCDQNDGSREDSASKLNISNDVKDTSDECTEDKEYKNTNTDTISL